MKSSRSAVVDFRRIRYNVTFIVSRLTVYEPCEFKSTSVVCCCAGLIFLQDEEERLIDQHHMLYHLFRERLYFPPIPYPRRVLDCGYGRGSWALTMAQHYAEAQVCKLCDIDVGHCSESTSVR